MADPTSRSRRQGHTAPLATSLATPLAWPIYVGLVALLIGCASPGQPRPPSLHLAQVVDNLSAERVGDRVHLRWTTPALTTDNLPAASPLLAVICRQPVSSAEPHKPCATISRTPASPGPSQVEDVLPPALTTGPPALLSYRVEILNPAGRSAGRSSEAFAASGSAPPAIEGLAATPIRGGVRLAWKQQPGAAAVELDRVDLGAAAAPAEAAQRQRRKRPGITLPTTATARSSTPSSSSTHLSAGIPGQPDAGGTIDESARKGATYTYSAQRVQGAVLEAHAVTLRSDPSPAVTVKLLETFPPQPPSGLEAAPGGAETPSIDLSWQPGVELDLAGYNVYRSELQGDSSAVSGARPVARPWQRLNSATVAVPAFHDSTVRVGTRYAYRITAVDSDRNESAPGNEVQETPGTR